MGCSDLKLFMDVWLQLYVKSLKVISHPQKKKKAKQPENQCISCTHRKTEVTGQTVTPKTD